VLAQLKFAAQVFAEGRAQTDMEEIPGRYYGALPESRHARIVTYSEGYTDGHGGFAAAVGTESGHYEINAIDPEHPRFVVRRELTDEQFLSVHDPRPCSRECWRPVHSYDADQFTSDSLPSDETEIFTGIADRVYQFAQQHSIPR